MGTVAALGLAFAVAAARTAPRQATRLEAQAQIHLRVGDLARAAACLEQAEALAPGRASVRAALAAVRAAQRDDAAAEALLREGAARAAPGEAEPALALARFLAAQGRGGEAWATLAPALPALEALEAAPAGRARRLLEAAQVARAGGDVRAAEALLRRAATGAAPAEALVALAELLEDVGRAREAAAALEAAQARGGDLPVVLAARAAQLERRGRGLEALALLEAGALVRGPKGEALREGAPRLATALVDLALRAGRLDVARRAARAAEGGADPLLAAQLEGRVALAAGEPERAERAYERLALARPDAALPRVLAARAAAAAGEAARARAHLEAALALEPGHPGAELAMLELDERAGEAEAVRARAERLLRDPRARAAALRALFALHARDRDAARTLARLEELARARPGDETIALYRTVFRVLARAGAGEGEPAELPAAPELAAALRALGAAQEAATDAYEAIELLAGLAAREPRLAPARLVLAEVYLRLGRVDLARRELDLAVEADPQAPAPRVLRATVLARRGGRPAERAAALADLEALARARPDDAGAAAALGELALDLRRLEVALPALERVAALRPDAAADRARLGLARLLRGERAAGALDLARARALDPGLPLAWADAVLDLAAGEVDGALPRLAQAATATGDPRFEAALVAARGLAGDPGGALEALARWSATQPSSAEALLLEVQLRALAGDAAGARAAAGLDGAPRGGDGRAPAAEASQVPPELLARAAGATGGAWTGQVLRAFALGVWALEEPALAQARELAASPDPEPLALWWALRALPPTAPLEVRRAVTRRLVEELPGAAGLALELAELQAAAGGFDEALATLELAAARRAGDPLLQRRLAALHDAAGDRARAVAAARRALALAPGDPGALNDLAWYLASDPGRADEAVDLARQALARAPRHPSIQDTLGWLLLQRGEVAEATPLLEAAARARPLDPSLRAHLARALLAQGKRERARNHLEVALLSPRPFPERTEAAALLVRLEADEPR